MADILFYVSYDNRMFHYRNRYNSQALLIVFYDWECQKPGLLPDLQPQKNVRVHWHDGNRFTAPPPSAKTAPNALGTTVTTDPKCKIGPKCTWHHRYDCPKCKIGSKCTWHHRYN